MEKGSCVKDIFGARQADGVFLIVEPHAGQGRNGAPYWSLKLVDATGSIDAKIWSPLSASITDLSAGTFAHVFGHASKYRDQTQFVIDKFQALDENAKASLNMALFLRASPYGIDAMFDELMAICRQEFTYAPWLNLIGDILSDSDIQQAFKHMPAAKNVHHAYAGGLLEHTLNVVKLCRFFADMYAELDKQTLIAGAILHDIGKIRELSGFMSTEYTQAGRLLGHIFLGIEIIDPFLRQSGLEPELCEHLLHLILSHHGELEYGAARLPQTAEAFALHYADNLDAKIAQCRNSLEGVDGCGFGAWQSTLNRGIFRAMPSPAAPEARKAGKSQPEEGRGEVQEVSFEGGGKICYDRNMPPDCDAPMYEDWEIPMDEDWDFPISEDREIPVQEDRQNLTRAEWDFPPRAPHLKQHEQVAATLAQTEDKYGEPEKQQGRQRNKEGQCSLPMKG